MGAWYTVGILVGVGVAIGVLAAGVVPRPVLVVAGAALIGIAVGFLAFDWDEAVGGGAGGALGGLGAAPIVAGALRRGGTRGGTAALVGLAAAVLAGLAFVPGLGYVEAAVLPLLALRARRREPERHAGLRTLARD